MIWFKAKDIFGSRVTNFDLATFKSRLPTLINSAAGRAQIIRQMHIFNEIESNYRNALKDIYSHYGLGNIAQKAEQLASQMTEERENELRRELLESEEEQPEKTFLSRYFQMSSPYEKALKQGYTDEQIQEYFAQKDPEFSSKYQKAIEAGYKPQEIYSHVSKPPKESLPTNAARQYGRTLARVNETILGVPRAAGEFLEMIVPEKALKAGAEKIGLKEPVEKGLEFAKKYAPHKLFPSSEEIRENVTKHLFGSRFEPKNQLEKFSDEAFSDFAAFSHCLCRAINSNCLNQPLSLWVVI